MLTIFRGISKGNRERVEWSGVEGGEKERERDNKEELVCCNLVTLNANGAL